MKTAVCIAGQPRFSEKGFEHLYENLIKPNNADVFFHCWYNGNQSYSSSWGTITTSVHHDVSSFLINNYKPIKFKIESEKMDFFRREFKKNTDAAVDITYSMIYSWCESIKLALDFSRENGFDYDCIVKTRFDAGLLDSIILDKMDLSKLSYSNSIRNPSVPCDWLNFGCHSVMKIYSELYSQLDKYCQEGCLICGEELLNFHLNKNSLDKQAVNVSLFLIRDEAFQDKTHFGRVF